MTDRDALLARAKAALEGVTEGPWTAPMQLLGASTGTVFGCNGEPLAYTSVAAGNTQFVADARTLVPDLVAALEDEIAQTAQAVEDWGGNDEQMLAENARLAADVERLRDQVRRAWAMPDDPEAEPQPTTPRRHTMTELVPAEDIERIVGIARHRTDHYVRAVSAEQRVYILHSRECLDGGADLRECRFSRALERGIDRESWFDAEDAVVALFISGGRLIPFMAPEGAHQP